MAMEEGAQQDSLTAVGESRHRIVTVVATLVLTWFLGWAFGASDRLAVWGVLGCATLAFLVILHLRNGARQTLKVYFSEASILRRLLEKKNTFWQILVSLILALFLSVVFTLVLKGLMITHGFLATLFIIILASIAIHGYFALAGGSGVTAGVAQHASDDVKGYAGDFIFLLLMAFWLNVVLSVVLSAFEVFRFLTLQVDFANFVLLAQDSAVARTGANDYSRPLINIYIVLESFKFAVANEIMAAFDFNMEQKAEYFYVFLFVILVFNLVKFFGFSLMLVLLQSGIGRFLAPALFRASLFLYGIARPVLERGGRFLGDKWGTLRARRRNETGENNEALKNKES